MAQQVTKTAGSSSQGRGLAVLRILLGVFFIFEGLSKLGWLADSGPLSERLAGYLRDAAPAARWYLETVAIPGAPIFARAVVLGELGAGMALVLGVWTRRRGRSGAADGHQLPRRQ